MVAASRFFGWSVAWSAFAIAVFAWGIGFYGPSVFLQSLHETRGWPISQISMAITAHFLLSAIVIAYLAGNPPPAWNRQNDVPWRGPHGGWPDFVVQLARAVAVVRRGNSKRSWLGHDQRRGAERHRGKMVRS